MRVAPRCARVLLLLRAAGTATTTAPARLTALSCARLGLPQRHAQLRAFRCAAAWQGRANRRRRRPSRGTLREDVPLAFTMAIVGRPNVGKSR